MCKHTQPEPYGQSQVIWTDRRAGTGFLFAECSECGQLMKWEIEA